MAKKTKASAEHIAEAKRLGANAHDTKKMRFPGGDTELMALCNTYPSFAPERADLMKAWIYAWDTQFLAKWRAEMHEIEKG